MTADAILLIFMAWLFILIWMNARRRSPDWKRENVKCEARKVIAIGREEELDFQGPLPPGALAIFPNLNWDIYSGTVSISKTVRGSEELLGRFEISDGKDLPAPSMSAMGKEVFFPADSIGRFPRALVWDEFPGIPSGECLRVRILLRARYARTPLANYDATLVEETLVIQVRGKDGLERSQYGFQAVPAPKV